MSEISPGPGASERASVPPETEPHGRAGESEPLENYFNYFTEVEECFQRGRGTPVLLSPLDWALIESCKEAGVPLEAVLIGIERAFAKFARRPQPFRKVNGLGYCVQTVMQAAEELAAAVREGGAGGRGSERREAKPDFTPQEIADYLEQNAEALEKAGGQCRAGGQPAVATDLAEAAAALRAIAAAAPEAVPDLRELENSLSAIEDRLTASVTRSASVEQLTAIRREFERSIAPHRRQMSALQIESLERQFLKKRLYEHYGVPRLSLFYL